MYLGYRGGRGRQRPYDEYDYDDDERMYDDEDYFEEPYQQARQGYRQEHRFRRPPMPARRPQGPFDDFSSPSKVKYMLKLIIASQYTCKITVITQTMDVFSKTYIVLCIAEVWSFAQRHDKLATKGLAASW